MLFFNDLMAECTQQELALRLLPLPAQERTGARVSLSRARSFLRPLLPSACYAGYVTREFTLLQKKTELLIVRIKNCERVSLKVNFVISLEAYDINLLAELVYQ